MLNSAIGMCREPPRLAPTPPPIIIIHSHTEKFVLYNSQGCYLAMCLPSLWRNPFPSCSTPPSPHVLLYCGIMLKFAKNHRRIWYGWQVIAETALS